jgi:hypothetical protein
MARFFASPKLQAFMDEVRNELRPAFLIATVPESRRDEADIQLLDAESALPPFRQTPLDSPPPSSNSLRMLPVVQSLEEWRVTETQKERVGGTMTLDQYDHRLSAASIMAVAFLLGLILVLVFSAWYLTI